MDKIYLDANDKNIAAYVVYANSSKELFYDSSFETEVPAADCVNLFVKGAVALYSGAYYRALSVTTEGVIDFGFPT